MTVYHLYGPAKALPTIIEYEADRFQNLSYDEPAFRTEAGAILGEYIKSASNPEQKMFETMSETAFTRHTYAHTVIGYLKDIQDMPSGYQYSREFFRRYYTPDNAMLFIAGDFDKAATLAQIQKAYGTWKGKLDAVRVPPEPKQRQSRRAQVDWDKPTLPRIWIAWHTPGAATSSGPRCRTCSTRTSSGPPARSTRAWCWASRPSTRCSPPTATTAIPISSAC